MKRAPAIAIVLLLSSGCGSSSLAPPDGGGGGGGGRGGGGGNGGSGGGSGGGGGGDAAVEHGTPSCTWDAVYRYGNNGGLVAYQDETTLTPPSSYKRTRDTFGNAAPLTCTPALPACNTAGALDVADITADLTAPDVLAALAQATPPLYGRDTRPVDGSVFQVLRADGHGFLVGSDCTAGDTSCTPAPAGVALLVADLRALDAQQVMDPSCAQLR
jgi:hypothetical protein